MGDNTFKQDVVALVVLGLLVGVIGTFIMYAAWPETTVTPGYTSSFSSMLDIEPTVEESGSAFGVFIGALLALAGQMMLVVAVIGCGVRLGLKNRAATPA